jgi:hypothetical protein
MKMKTIAALAITASCLAFTLPSVASNRYFPSYSSQMQSPSVAYQQKNELSSRVDGINKALIRMASQELGVNFPYFEGDLSSRVDRINKELIRMARQALGVNFPYFEGDLSSRVDKINKELIRMARQAFEVNFPYFQ